MVAAATELGIDGFVSAPSSIQLQNGISKKSFSISAKKLDLSCNSEITTLPISNGDLPPFSNGKVELISLESTTYTSLRDMLPEDSPSSRSYYEIPIKNRLVQLAAWAYMQPMSNSSENRDGDFFRRLSVRCPVNCVNDQADGCFVFINEEVFPIIKRAFGGILRKISGRRIGE